MPPLITSRFRTAADVQIDASKCSACGLCVRVCKGAPLTMAGGRVDVDQNRVFGCIACGQCIAVCPQDAIRVEGRDLAASDILPVPPAEEQVSYDQLKALLLSRRSVRDFRDQPVSEEHIQRILDAAATAPMGLPPSDVSVAVFSGREKVQDLRADLMGVLARRRWLFSPWFAKAMRPLMGPEAADTLATFGRTVCDVFLHPEKYEGRDWFLYDAPLAMLFHASPYADPADPFIPATYAMLAAHSLGLGACMLGVPGVLLKMDRGLRTKLCGHPRANPGIVVIFGHPAITYRRAITRHFARVTGA